MLPLARMRSYNAAKRCFHHNGVLVACCFSKEQLHVHDVTNKSNWSNDRFKRFFSTNAETSKVFDSAEEALADCIFPTASINVGGFGLGGIPETLLNELANNERAQDLTVASLTAGVDGFGLGLLFEAGKIKRMIASYVGENQVSVDIYHFLPHKNDNPS